MLNWAKPALHFHYWAWALSQLYQSDIISEWTSRLKKKKKTFIFERFKIYRKKMQR